MGYRTIVTHPGQAHRDEFIACCMVLAYFEEEKGEHVKIMRREPTSFDLEDKDVIVIDVGGQFDPSLNNYDHHQFGRDANPCCSISLIIESFLGKNLAAAYDAFPWLEFSEWLDCRGPFKTNDRFGMPNDSMFSVSPIETVLLRLFQKYTIILSDESHIGYIMLRLGEDWIGFIDTFTDRLASLALNAQYREPHGVKVLDVTCIDGSDSPTLALEAFTKKWHPNCQVTITNDNRSDGLSLYRRNDDPSIDFSLAKDHPDVLFAHASGFLIKTKTKNADWTELIYKSIVKN